MSGVAISGIGSVSPFGVDVAALWRKVAAGERPPLSHLASPFSARRFPYYAVPREVVQEYQRHPRLRRSSEISHFAAIAGMQALRDAGLEKCDDATRIGLVFGISSGGVRYTTRFFEDILATGAGTASPLLFPETVYNAPASHLAALLQLNGLSYSLVGDSSVGLSALSFGADLVATDQLDHCVVVCTEEAEWILCEAFRRCRIFTGAEETRPFQGAGKRGTVFSEGAVAVTLSRSGPVEIARLHRGVPFFKNADAAAALTTVLAELQSAPGAVFCGANGTAFDDAESAALDRIWPEATRLACKASLGESVGAACLQQVILAVQSFRENRLPTGPTAPETIGISAIGYNALATGCVLRKASTEAAF